MTIHRITLDLTVDLTPLNLSVLCCIILCYLHYDKWVLLNDYEWINGKTLETLGSVSKVYTTYYLCNKLLLNKKLITQIHIQNVIKAEH